MMGQKFGMYRRVYGGKSSATGWFKGETTEHSQAFVISSFGILVLALIQHTQNNAWKESAIVQRIRATVQLLTDTCRLDRDIAQIQSLR